MLAVAHVLGLMMAFFAIVYALPLLVSLIFQDGYAHFYIAAAAINVLFGLGVAATTRRYKRELKSRDGFLLVTLAWVLLRSIVLSACL